MNKNIVNSVFMIIMLSLISGFVIFISAYMNFASTEDMMYNSFLSSHAKLISLNLLDTSGTEKGSSIIKETFEDLGDNFILYKVINMSSRRTSESIKAIYSKGDEYIPPIVSGRYFTREEFESDARVCLVGKSFYDGLNKDENGVPYYDMAGIRFTAIGCIGTEHDTQVNNLIMLNLNPYMKEMPAEGVFYIDAKNETDARNATNSFLRMFTLGDYSKTFSAVYVPETKKGKYMNDNVMTSFIFAGLLILLNIIMLCAQYTDRLEYSMAVKKMLGISPLSAIAEQLLKPFIASTISYIAGYIIVLPLLYGVMNPLLGNSVYLQINFLNILIAYLLTLLIATVLTVPFVIKVYMVDTSEKLRCKE